MYSTTQPLIRALLLLLGGALVQSKCAIAQTNAGAIVIDSIKTSFSSVPQKVTPTAKFGHTIGAGDVEVFYFIFENPPYCADLKDPKLRLPSDIIGIELLEDTVTVARRIWDCFPTGSLSYTPLVPGLKTLYVVALRRDGSRTLSPGVQVSMFGVSLETALGRTIATPYLPFTSRIFLETNALLGDANIKKAQFFHRSLPFPLSDNAHYAAGDKVVSDGKLFQALTPGTIATGHVRTLAEGGNTETNTIDGVAFRYIGPRLMPDVDYYNYRPSTDPSISFPGNYPAPPPGRADLVISRDADGNDNVYEVVTAGTVSVDVNGNPPTLAGPTPSAAGHIGFSVAGGPLQSNASYHRGDLVLSNGRVYEAVQDGLTSSDLGVGLLNTDGQIQTIGSVPFNFIPSKVLRELLAYWRDDLVISNGSIYTALNPGTIAFGQLGTGLTGQPGMAPQIKQTIVQFRQVGGLFTSPHDYFVGDVVSSGGRIYKVTSVGAKQAGTGSGGSPSSSDPYASQTIQVTNSSSPTTYQNVTFQLVTPQYHKYAEIDADYAGIPLEEHVVYQVGDIVVSDNNLYEVVSGGTMGPLGAGLSTDSIQVSGGLTFKFIGPFFKQISKIRPQALRADAIYAVGQRVVSNGRVYEITRVPSPYVALTADDIATGLTSTAPGEQLLGGFSFIYTSQPFVDVPLPYSSFDYSYPYNVKWSPADTINNHYSWFGRSGYFEDQTFLELVTRITDSKDRTNISGTIPVSILPPIDARASLVTTVTAPSNDRVVAASTPVQITAESKDINGVVRLVQSVQFFVDGVALYAPDVSFPYTTELPNHWTPTVAGTYILNAVAVDDKGNYTISRDIRVNVTDNQPFVRITTTSASDPLNPLKVQSGQTILIQGVESGSGGDPTRVTAVQLFSDGNLIGLATPGMDGRFGFSFTPSNASTAPINYQITARVIDLNGAIATSNTIYIQVAVAPVVGPSPTPSTSPSPGASPSPSATPGRTTSGKLANLSTRGPVEFGTDVMIGGFIIQGSASRQIVIRGMGPSLTAFGVADALQDPTLSLRDANGNQLEFNDNYTQAPQSEQDILNANGLTPTDGRESAIVATLPPGLYTAILRGKTNGVGLVELYDLSVNSKSVVVNISTRAKVEQGDNGALIGGFIIQGTDPQRVIIRAVGPSLKTFGVTDALLDPTLDLYRGSSKILSNDNWKSTQQTEIQATGLAPTNDKEAALVLYLDPGSYTAVIRGKNNTTGVALAEVYNIAQ